MQWTSPKLDAQTLAYYDDVDEQTAARLEHLTHDVLHRQMGYAAKWGEGTGVLHGLFVNWYSGQLHQIPVHIVAAKHDEQPELRYDKGGEILIEGAVAAHRALVEAKRPSIMLIVNGELDHAGFEQVERLFAGVEEGKQPTRAEPAIADQERARAPSQEGKTTVESQGEPHVVFVGTPDHAAQVHEHAAQLGGEILILKAPQVFTDQPATMYAIAGNALNAGISALAVGAGAVAAGGDRLPPIEGRPDEHSLEQFAIPIKDEPLVKFMQDFRETIEQSLRSD